MADHCPCVAVVALDGGNNVLTVTQYRYAFGRALLEIPAGKLEEGEEPAAGALRELREETGAVPDELLPMGKILPSPGCLGEELYLFLARGLTMGEARPDEDEFLRLERIPMEELAHRCLRGEIEDGKTVAAVLKAKLLLNL
ncbi:Methanol dehydrogenase activator [bioreactor metagenome]|uniref:Methanol dehydrogenase activator n=1 Tax=bioreactor metagenome TaxID=1076179 RepID=A0A645C5A4_9ZZZZ